MPNSLETRRQHILDLVEYAHASEVNSLELFSTLYWKARTWFLVTEETAKDYASLAIHVMNAPARVE